MSYTSHMNISPTLPSRLLDAAESVAAFGVDFDALTDEQLFAGMRAISQLDRVKGIFAAGIAGEMRQRSRHELGDSGLAQRHGFVNTESLIQSITGAPRAEAAKQVAVGRALDTPVGAALLDGQISLDAADAIHRALGTVTPESPLAAAELLAATSRLIDDAQIHDADDLAKRARVAREELDADCVARREKEQRDLRYFKAFRRTDGMVRGSFLLDPLAGGEVLAAIDAVLSPRRGGPRMVDASQKALDAILESDARTNDQIAADAFVDIVRLAMDADPGTLFGSRRPAVRVIVGQRALATRSGAGQLEDGGESITLEAVERLICDAGIIPIEFDDDGQCMNVGRTQRFFTARQRVALAVRDGGCRVLNCGRPASWAEAHHINHWKRDKGKTDVADGILLCRRHHMMFHNNGWEIVREGADYWLIPPREVDPTQTRIPMPSKARALEKRVS